MQASHIAVQAAQLAAHLRQGDEGGVTQDQVPFFGSV